MGSTDAMLEVQNGRLDATVQDLPPALFYRNRYPGLHFVDPQVGRGFYVIYLRPDQESLRDKLNAALLDLIRSGQLRSLYERYGLWNAAQEQLGTPGLGAVQKSEQVRGWEVIRRNLPILLQAPRDLTRARVVAPGRPAAQWPPATSAS